MKRLLILGGGTAGTMTANKLYGRLDHDRWQITVVDTDDRHLYQPGLLFVPFGVYDPEEIVRPRHRYISQGIELVLAEVESIEPQHDRVLLAGGDTLSYDYLVIATGATSRPDQTPGMLDGEWRDGVHDFYTLEGANALADKLREWEGGRLVVQVVDMPIKCPVAPLEFTFLSD